MEHASGVFWKEYVQDRSGGILFDTLVNCRKLNFHWENKHSLPGLYGDNVPIMSWMAFFMPKQLL